MDRCIFCRIDRKEVPSFTIYEDELVLVFLAKPAIIGGHMLVVPKTHKIAIFDLSDEELGRIFKVAKKMSNLLISKLGATGVNLLNASGKDAQQSVFHFHLHIVPRYPNDGMDLWYGKYPEINVDQAVWFEKLVK